VWRVNGQIQFDVVRQKCDIRYRSFAFMDTESGGALKVMIRDWQLLDQGGAIEDSFARPTLSKA
jgi:hypothetical protein